MPDMAEIVDPPSSARGGPQRRPVKYPWQEWTDGHWRLAVPGVDYTCKDGTFQFQCYQQGYRRNLRAETRRIEGKGVMFRFIPKEGGSP